MSSSWWLLLDQILGYAEVILVPFSIAYLLLALLRDGRGRAIRAAVLAIFLALTVAQPFGVKGVPITPAEYRAGDPQPADAEAVHSVDLLGIPLFGFRPYTREIFYVNGESGYPTSWLKLRSWLWPGLLTNATKLEKLCGATFDPCWVPADQVQYGRDRSENLQLVNADGQWRYRILTFDGTPTDQVSDYRGYYRLAVGFVSTAGAIYWVLVACLLIAIFGRLRQGAQEAMAEFDGRDADQG
jgi:hypothetical protein